MGLATQTISAAPRQLSDGNSDGTVLGQSPADLIGFFGAAAVPQPSGANQALFGIGTGAAAVVTYQSTLSPSAVAANTTAEQTFTVTGLAASSLVAVNKPTSQAGLGISGVRVSAANTLAISFCNDTSGSITPTASEVYTTQEFKAGLVSSAALTPTAVAANTSVEQQFTLAGAAVGMLLLVNKPTNQAGLGIGNIRVVSNDLIGITFFNNTAAAITPTAAESYSFAATNGLSTESNVMTFGVNVGTLSACATITTAEQTVAVAGLLTTDVIMGVSKPTAQAGLGIAGYRVSSAGNLGITFVNPTVAGITPTASEVYQVSVFRQSPLPILANLTPTLTPVSVAANTSAEQAFTVTGLVASSSVIVNKPSYQQGLSIVGVRISAANTLQINFQNNTAGAIVPAAEAYTVGNFNVAGAGSGLSVSQGARAPNLLTNALRTAMVSLGLIAGQ